MILEVFFFFYKIDPKLLLQHNFTKFNFQLLCLSIKLAWSFVLLCHDEAVQFIIKYLNNIGFNKILIINYLKQILDGQYCGTISVMLFLLKIEEKNDVNGVQYYASFNVCWRVRFPCVCNEMIVRRYIW